MELPILDELSFNTFSPVYLPQNLKDGQAPSTPPWPEDGSITNVFYSISAQASSSKSCMKQIRHSIQEVVHIPYSAPPPRRDLDLHRGTKQHKAFPQAQFQFSPRAFGARGSSPCQHVHSHTYIHVSTCITYTLVHVCIYTYVHKIRINQPTCVCIYIYLYKHGMCVKTHTYMHVYIYILCTHYT